MINMTKKIVSFSLTKQTIQRIDLMANALWISRSELVDWVFGKYNFNEAIVERMEALRNEIRDIVKAKQ